MKKWISYAKTNLRIDIIITVLCILTILTCLLIIHRFRRKTESAARTLNESDLQTGDVLCLQYPDNMLTVGLRIYGNVVWNHCAVVVRADVADEIKEMENLVAERGISLTEISNQEKRVYIVEMARHSIPVKKSMIRTSNVNIFRLEDWISVNQKFEKVKLVSRVESFFDFPRILATLSILKNCRYGITPFRLLNFLVLRNSPEKFSGYDINRDEGLDREMTCAHFVTLFLYRAGLVEKTLRPVVVIPDDFEKMEGFSGVPRVLSLARA